MQIKYNDYLHLLTLHAKLRMSNDFMIYDIMQMKMSPSFTLLAF